MGRLLHVFGGATCRFAKGLQHNRGAGAQHEARCEAPHQEHHENEQQHWRLWYAVGKE